MLRREPCAQRANAACANDSQAYVFSFESDDALLFRFRRIAS